MRPAGGGSGKGAGQGPSAPAPNSRLVNGAFEPALVAREILEQFHIHVKVQDERQVLRADDLAHKGLRLHLFARQHAALTGAGVHQNPHRQRRVRLPRKVSNLLWVVVFRQLEIVFGQVGNEMSMVVFDHGEDVDDAGRDLECLGGRRRGRVFLREERQPGE